MPNPENLVPLEKGTERTKRISAMGAEANRIASKKRADTKAIGNRLGKILMMDLKKSGCITTENLRTYEEAENSTGDVLDEILKLLIKDALAGGKTSARARTQILEYMQAADEVKRDTDASEFLNALTNAVNDWKNE